MNLSKSMKRIPDIIPSLSLLIFSLIFFGCSQSATTPEKPPPATSGQTTVNDQSAASDKTAFQNPPSQNEEEKEVGIDPLLDNDEVAEEGDDESEEEDEFGEFEDEYEEMSDKEVYDPLSGYNRVMTGFNDKLYFWVLKPVASGYKWAVPESPRRGIRRFFTNLFYPVRFVNNLLQLKFKNAGEETLRFVTNSTIGILGFWDPAKEWFNLEAHSEDFGQTLGYYGVGAGPHIVLPVLGPSNLRDTFALAPDMLYLEPYAYVDDYKLRYGTWAIEKVNMTSLRIGEYESLKKDAVDFYIFMRDGYEKIRENDIKE